MSFNNESNKPGHLSPHPHGPYVCGPLSTKKTKSWPRDNQIDEIFLQRFDEWSAFPTDFRWSGCCEYTGKSQVKSLNYILIVFN